MKKNYIVPSTEIIEVQTESLLQGLSSLGMEEEFVGSEDDGAILLTPQRPYSIWDDDSEW